MVRVWMSLKALATATLVCLVTVPTAYAEIVVNVDQGVTAPVPIAITTFSGPAIAAQISKVISDDLEHSQLFRPLDPAIFKAGAPDISIAPQFDSWKAIGAQGLLNGEVSVANDGRLRVVFRLWDVYAGDNLVGAELTAAPESWRRLAHKIADAVYQKLTGQPGYFDTKIAFVAESGSRAKPIRRLAIMDQDGANSKILTDGANLVFTPRFSSTSLEISYMALRPTGSTLYLRNTDSGREEALGRFAGMVFAPRFSADGRKVAFSLESAGNTDIYVMDLASHALSRLTTDPAIDTSPSFSPDGSQVVYNSDHGGSPQLYIMNLDGSNSHRISFGAGRYTTPVWSPNGSLIAFTKQQGPIFHIGVMRPDGTDERLLTTSYLDEGPTWAPNSRTIMFSRESRANGAHLWTVDIGGHGEQPSGYPLGASDPAWSPLLP